MRICAPFFRLCLALLLSGAVSGCTWMKDKTYTAREAETNLVAFCKKEGGLDIITRMSQKTQWIYLPLTEPIFALKPGDKPRADAERKAAPFSLLSLDGKFDQDKKFSFVYDIVPDVLPGDMTTYGMAYSEPYTKKKQLLYQGLQETFFNIKEAEAPQFFVIVIADISQGIATKSTFYLRDVKEFMTGAIYEEYYLRELNEVLGDKELIGDKTGRSLNYAPVAWSDFLTEQIKSRIRYKFTQSEFKPQTDPEKTIITLAANALKIYPFRDFTGLYLYNRRDKKERLLSQEDLKSFEEMAAWEKNKDRLTVIRYEAGKGMTIEDNAAGKQKTGDLPQ